MNFTRKILAFSRTCMRRRFATLDLELGTVAAKSAAAIRRQTRRSPRQWNIFAYPTAQAYDLGKISASLENAGVYNVKTIGPPELHEVCRLATMKSHGVDAETPHFFVFADGAVVFWNYDEARAKEKGEIISSFYAYAADPLDEETMREEAEKLYYKSDESIESTHFTNNEDLVLKSGQDVEECVLDRYAVSNAMVASVKLSTHESTLDRIVETLTPDIRNMKKGEIKLNKRQVIKLTGRLFQLRHDISLNSDLLEETPDFYWDRGNLSKIYSQACRLFAQSKRTRVINEKLNYCLEFGERLESHLTAMHSSFLEWCIIVLIAVEIVLGSFVLFFEYSSYMLEREQHKKKNV